MRKIIVILIIILIAVLESKGQETYNVLNYISAVFSNRQENLYDEAENYLNYLSKDSIEGNFSIEILFHTNMAYLYELKYNDFEKSSEELGYIVSKFTPYKHLPEYQDSYKSLLYAYAYSLSNSGQLDKAEKYFYKLVIAVADNYDIRLYYAYHGLAYIYERQNNPILAEECHSKCQEFLVNSYIRKHPEHSFYLDNFKTLKFAISQFEKREKNNTVEYVNTLCSLGALLHKVDQGESWETVLVLFKAHKCAIDNGIRKSDRLGECYYSLLDILSQTSDPYSTQLIEGMIPYMVDYYSDIKGFEDMFEHIASSYRKNQQYEKALVFDLKVVESQEKDLKQNVEKIKRTYKNLVLDYLGHRTDSTNQLAFQYLQKLKKTISKKDTYYYDWFIDNQAVILRYLYRENDAIRCFNSNLSYFKKKYGEESEKYISTLNQIALCYPAKSNECFAYLSKAKTLISKSKDVDESTVRGVSINLARYYILNYKYKDAMSELVIAKSIEIRVLGEVLPVTQELINQCMGK